MGLLQRGGRVRLIRSAKPVGAILDADSRGIRRG
jgi:hypothetical protein